MTTNSKEDGDPDGPFHVGIISELKDGKLFRVSSPYLLDSNVDGMASGGKLLDTESVEGLLDILAKLSWDELVSADASDEMLMEKQLTDDTAAMITVSSGADELMKMYFGTTDEEGGNYYARLFGSRMIYTVSRDTLSSLLSIDVDDLRPSTLLDVSLEDMTRIVYATEGGTWVSVSVEMTAEKIEGEEANETDGAAESPAEPELAFSEMDETLWNALMKALTMDGYVTDELPGSLLLTLELTAENGSTATMTISEQSVDSYYLVMTGRDDCLISADGADKLLRTLRKAK